MNNATYEGGAVRTEVKPAYYLVNPQFTRLVASAMSEGKASKGEYNYRSGGAEFIKACYDHCMDHLHGLIETDPEDFEALAEHIGHAAANLNMLTYFLYRDGELPAITSAGIRFDIDSEDNPYVEEFFKNVDIRPSVIYLPDSDNAMIKEQVEEEPEAPQPKLTVLDALRKQLFGAKNDVA